jgi:hypothetical protein
VNTKGLFIIVLTISIIGFSSGVYHKYIKPYSEDRLQIERTNLNGEKIQRQLNLGEMIVLLNRLESIKKANRIESDENDVVIKRLKTINAVLILGMLLCVFAFIWSIQKLRKLTFRQY